MAGRLGLAILTGAGWRARDIETIACEAENAGFEAIFNVEANNDALATAQLMGVEVESWLRGEGPAMIAPISGQHQKLGDLVLRPKHKLHLLVRADRLAAATASIGELQGRLRTVHLAAHLETRTLLNPDQIARYQQLRGYGDSQAPVQHHHHG